MCHSRTERSRLSWGIDRVKAGSGPLVVVVLVLTALTGCALQPGDPPVFDTPEQATANYLLRAAQANEQVVDLAISLESQGLIGEELAGTILDVSERIADGNDQAVGLTRRLSSAGQSERGDLLTELDAVLGLLEFSISELTSDSRLEPLRLLITTVRNSIRLAVTMIRGVQGAVRPDVPDNLLAQNFEGSLA